MTNKQPNLVIYHSNKENELEINYDLDNKSDNKSTNPLKSDEKPAESDNPSKPGSIRSIWRRFSLFHFLFDSKIKYVLLLLFFAYFLFNTFIFMANFKTNLPIIEFIPDQSFLRHHMVNHMSLFNIGPIITIAFIKPLKYWDRGTFRKINSFLAEAKQLDNVDKHMEISWLDETYLNSKAKAEFYAIKQV